MIIIVALYAQCLTFKQSSSAISIKVEITVIVGSGQHNRAVSATVKHLLSLVVSLKLKIKKGRHSDSALLHKIIRVPSE